MIRLEGTSITYHLWITRVSGRSEMLVLRCDGHGNLLASIRSDIERCNRDAGA